MNNKKIQIVKLTPSELTKQKTTNKAYYNEITHGILLYGEMLNESDECFEKRLLFKIPVDEIRLKMKYEELKDIVKTGEDYTIEFKESISSSFKNDATKINIFEYIKNKLANQVTTVESDLNE